MTSFEFHPPPLLTFSHTTCHLSPNLPSHVLCIFFVNLSCSLLIQDTIQNDSENDMHSQEHRGLLPCLYTLYCQEKINSFSLYLSCHCNVRVKSAVRCSELIFIYMCGASSYETNPSFLIPN